MTDLFQNLPIQTTTNLVISLIAMVLLLFIVFVKENSKKEYNLTNFVFKYVYSYFILIIFFNFIKGFFPINMFYIKITILTVIVFLILFIISYIIKLRDIYFYFKKFDVKKTVLNIIQLENKDIAFQITKDNELICFLSYDYLSDEEKYLLNKKLTEKNIVDTVQFLHKQ